MREYHIILFHTEFPFHCAGKCVLSALCALSAYPPYVPYPPPQHHAFRHAAHSTALATLLLAARGRWIKHEMKISRRQISPIKSYRQNLCGLWHPKVANASRRDANGPIVWRTHPPDTLSDATHGMPCAVFSAQRRPRSATFHKKGCDTAIRDLGKKIFLSIFAAMA